MIIIELKKDVFDREHVSWKQLNGRRHRYRKVAYNSWLGHGTINVTSYFCHSCLHRVEGPARTYHDLETGEREYEWWLDGRWIKSAISK